MSATCSWCNQEMSPKGDCSGNLEVEFPDGKKLPSIPYNPEHGGADQTCHDCNVRRGGRHHPGCDMEECPRCTNQLIGCGCLDKEEEDEEDE